MTSGDDFGNDRRGKGFVDDAAIWRRRVDLATTGDTSFGVKGRRHARAKTPPAILKFALFSIIAIPPYMVLAPIGASGSVSMLLALILLGGWVSSAFFGHHDPLLFGTPARLAVGLLILASCASYVSMFAGLSGATDSAGRAAADRWILLMFASAAIVMATTECVRTLDDAMSLVRWVLAGSVVCSIAAIIQFIFRINPVEWIKPFMPGFIDNASATTFQVRDGMMRISGTTMHPIELAAIAAMLLPLAIWRSLYDQQGRKWRHWATVGLLLLGNMFTVSRTGLIGLAIAVAVVIPFLPALARKWSLVIVPLCLVGLFVAIPGLASTLFNTASAGSSDSSITYRTDDYPLVVKLVTSRPWLGLGPNNWMPQNAKDIFDNQYLLTAVTVGIFGLIGFLMYLLLPTYAAFAALRKAEGAELKLLAASIGAAGLIATVASGTFDSMSFQVFALLVPFFVGLSGAVWIMVKNQLQVKRELEFWTSWQNNRWGR